ncbi:hypothetical protein [Neodiprion sertifer nucleopolyhedrovirus]|uniref:Uncharacterized protein n=1 Tax=Neodiprion sertifer nucleopolyhedrovirus TaxID=111874 RepID=Q6JKE0_9CBAC|nr:hypothetical protein NeseNPV_gp20 [Neodiprion sertifer nucleopolyhedrovirus]AAQ96397.1 hypothetical protein [Neodiprion sertifer nucleopolyhedrovirus]
MKIFVWLLLGCFSIACGDDWMAFNSPYGFPRKSGSVGGGWSKTKIFIPKKIIIKPKIKPVARPKNKPNPWGSGQWTVPEFKFSDPAYKVGKIEHSDEESEFNPQLIQNHTNVNQSIVDNDNTTAIYEEINPLIKNITTNDTVFNVFDILRNEHNIYGDTKSHKLFTLDELVIAVNILTVLFDKMNALDTRITEYRDHVHYLSYFKTDDFLVLREQMKQRMKEYIHEKNQIVSIYAARSKNYKIRTLFDVENLFISKEYKNFVRSRLCKER